jgi:hypothetical protein
MRSPSVVQNGGDSIDWLKQCGEVREMLLSAGYAFDIGGYNVSWGNLTVLAAFVFMILGRMLSKD